jgi:GT2 family glycosyltransferase
VVIVAHDSLSDLRHSLPPLIGELAEEDELIVVDSGSADGIRTALVDLAPGAGLIEADGNVGFARGANIGAAAATGDLIVLLNPDAVVEHGWAAALRAASGAGWTAWMGLVTMGSGDTINTSGGVLHFTGVGWAGQVGRPVSEAPREPHAVAFASGACLAIATTDWRRIGGFSDWYFMYCEDVDLSLRIHLQGGAVGVIPAARVVHSYDFRKGPGKWRMLERNRWATILRCYPSRLLLLVIPALVIVELATWMVALRGHWGTMKALATADVMRALPRLLRERREIQRGRTIDVIAFSDVLTAQLDSPYLGGYARRPAVAASQAYWWLVRRLLGASAMSDPVGHSPVECR